MNDIFGKIERKNRAIWLVAVLLVMYNVLRLLSIVASPYPIDQVANMDIGISVSEYQVTFQNYIIEESEKVQIPPHSLKIIILYSVCMAASYIFLSLPLGMRKKFAKYIVLSLVVVELIIDIYLGIKYSLLPSKNSILIAIFLLIFLYSPNITKEFK